ncbi:MAG: mechanosensitive ion channel family protein [Euryarchaeota archaeon]|jgi:small-conductance mechanosensitive channel|nr:mechanosensitive ion channel family protein [Euryarchaeota archaeon]MBT5184812.1 mechanosensitive ion channel family protein [Euryarchaeota archaeon]
MALISDLLDYLDSLPFSAKVILCILGTALALIGTKYVLIRPWKEIVKGSSAGWDDKLLGPLAVRLNLFILAAGGQISSIWLIESDIDYNTLQPYFGASYIMIATSISSVSAKYLMPVMLEQFQKRDAVTISGGNPILVICTRATLYFIGTYFALIELDIDLFGIFASLTLISIILGIAMQQTISNIANSFLLAVDRPFEVGDRIEVGEIIGTVVSIGILSTKVLNHDERLVIIPNNTIVSSDIVNHARGGGEGIASRKSLVIDIGVSYDEDIDHVKYTLLKLARESPHCLKKPEPRVLINELDEFTKNFRLFAWVENYNIEFIARDWILKYIDENFNSEGISISFPTEVEIKDEASSTDLDGKAERQQIAREQMILEEQRFQEEREAARLRLKELEKEMLKAELSGVKISDLEFEAQALDNELNIFKNEG